MALTAREPKRANGCMIGTRVVAYRCLYVKEASMELRHGLRLAAEYRQRVWGGQRLKPSDEPYGEAWIVWEGNRIEGGSLAGRTLAEAAAQFGGALIGTRALRRSGVRFPLLIKLLDTADWLSVQVHPNDEQARRLEGPDQFGKTEAW